MTDVATDTPAGVLGALVFDIFPGAFRSPSGVRDGVRIAANRNRLIVYGETGHGGTRRPTILHDIEVESIEPLGRRLWSVHGVDGLDYVVGPGHGCGCGSTLKRLPQPLPTSL
jgi:hypothetical protein